jgi:hypothetical protein
MKRHLYELFGSDSEESVQSEETVNIKDTDTSSKRNSSPVIIDLTQNNDSVSINMTLSNNVLTTGVESPSKSLVNEHDIDSTISLADSNSSGAGLSSDYFTENYISSIPIGVRVSLAPIIQNTTNQNIVSFVKANLPSTWSNNDDVHWIYIRNPSLDNNPHNNRKYIGKWMWFVDRNFVDRCFLIVSHALMQGLLGHAAKVPPPNSSTIVPIIVYTTNFMDKEDILRVGLMLRKIGNIRKTISYKPDIFTLMESGIHGTNTCQYKSIYQLKPNSDSLECVDNGNAIALALELALNDDFSDNDS